MTNEEAVKTIEVAIAEVEWNYPMDYAIAFEAAISALEKQIPKKPNIYNRFERHCECGTIVKTYQNYCSNCGQALDWSDTE